MGHRLIGKLSTYFGEMAHFGDTKFHIVLLQVDTPFTYCLVDNNIINGLLIPRKLEAFQPRFLPWMLKPQVQLLWFSYPRCLIKMC